MQEIIVKLFQEQDLNYRAFHAKLIPNIDPESIIGVRSPILQKMAKGLAKHPSIEAFLTELPHHYYEENNLHGYIISQYRDYDKAIKAIDAFLPYVDNWATCDLIRPKAFQKNHDRLSQEIERWMNSDQPYTIRFGIEMAMVHYIDKDFDHFYPEKIAQIRSNEYYVNMMLAWYFATALAKQWDSIIPYLESAKLDIWVHNKTIQKAIESYRITPEQKQYLKSLKHFG